MIWESQSAWKDDSVVAVAELAQKFFEERVVPREAEWIARRQVDRSLWVDAGKLGLLSCGIPVRFGGGGGTDAHDLAVVEAQSGCPDTSMGVHVNGAIVPRYVLHHGTEDQREFWLPKLASGETVGAIAMTEPGAGSDLKQLRTRARTTDAGHFVLSGSKTFITNGASADVVIVAARTAETGSARDISLLIVEPSCPGFSRGKTLQKIGQHGADTCELFFDDVVVPRANLLGECLGRGFAQLMDELPFERLITAISAMGSMECAVRETVSYARDRHMFGSTLFDLQNTRFVLADAATKVRAVRAFLDECVALQLQGKLDAGTAAMIKLWSTTVQGEVVDACLQLFGGYGYMQENRIARLYEDARITRIYGGANEVMKEIIARSL